MKLNSLVEYPAVYIKDEIKRFFTGSQKNTLKCIGNDSPLAPSLNVPGISSDMAIDATIKIPESFSEYPPLPIPRQSLMENIKKKFEKEEFWQKLFGCKS